MMIKDRLLSVAKPRSVCAGCGHGPFRFLHHIDVCDNSPRTSSKAKALRLSAETAEKLRFNLTARGWKVRVVFA